MATEIAYLKLKANTNLTDSGPAKTVWQDSLSTILGAPGCQRLYWGVTAEDASTLRLFVDWDSVDAHRQFTATDAYKPFADTLMTILDGVQGPYHAHVTPFPPTAALSKRTSPATELLMAYVPANYSQSQMEKFEQDFRLLVTAIEENGAGYYETAAGGWCVEDDVKSPANEEHTGKAFFAAVGWKSVQHHLDFRNTQAFKDNIHLLRGADGLLGVHVQHYHGTEVHRS